MRKVIVFRFFERDLRIQQTFVDGTYGRFYRYFDESTTYEEMVATFIAESLLPPLDDPRLRYNLVLQAFEIKIYGVISPPAVYPPPHSLSTPVILREGQTLASTQLTRLVMDESEVKHLPIHNNRQFDSIRALFCTPSIEIRDAPSPTEKPSSASPNWGQMTVGGVLGFLIGQTANIASIIGALDVIERRWREWRTAHDATPQRGIPQVSETDIVAIRLLMTNGSRHTFEEWLTDPDRLKHYIDVFNQPSSSIQPLQASFVQRNGEALRVDVSRGAQNNLQLDELLSYLKIDPAER